MVTSQRSTNEPPSRAEQAQTTSLSNEHAAAGTESAEELVKQLWNFGNVITAFTVAQSLTGIYFILEKFRVVWVLRTYAMPGFAFIMAGAGVYCLAVWLCYRLEGDLRRFLGQPSVVLRTSRFVMRVRMATILMFNSIFVTIGLIATRNDFLRSVVDVK